MFCMAAVCLFFGAHRRRHRRGRRRRGEENKVFFATLCRTALCLHGGTVAMRVAMCVPPPPPADLRTVGTRKRGENVQRERDGEGVNARGYSQMQHFFQAAFHTLGSAATDGGRQKPAPRPHCARICAAGSKKGAGRALAEGRRSVLAREASPQWLFSWPLLRPRFSLSLLLTGCSVVPDL